MYKNGTAPLANRNRNQKAHLVDPGSLAWTALLFWSSLSAFYKPAHPLRPCSTAHPPGSTLRCTRWMWWLHTFVPHGGTRNAIEQLFLSIFLLSDCELLKGREHICLMHVAISGPSKGPTHKQNHHSVTPCPVSLISTCPMTSSKVYWDVTEAEGVYLN